MAELPQKLPKFKKPPVIEVAICVFFRPLVLFKTAHFGRFWDHNPEYKRTEDHPPVFESAPMSPEALSLALQPRVFFISEDDTGILQVQPNFLGHNWRRGEHGAGYPGFEPIRQRFLEKWHLFRNFVSEEKLGDVQAVRYEIAYINHFTEEAGAFPLAIEKYSPVIKLRQSKPEFYLPNPKSLSAEIQYEIEKNQGTLRASFKQGVWGPDKKEVMQLDMVLEGVQSPTPRTWRHGLRSGILGSCEASQT